MNNDIAQAYELLGVTPDVSDKEMRSAWRKLVRSYHPDLARTDPEEASRRMGEINAAYDAVAHHRLQKDKMGATTAGRDPRPKTVRPKRRSPRATANPRRSHRTENTQREAKQEQPRETLAKRRTYRSPQEQRLIDAACAVFEETRRHLNAAARQPAFSTCR
ncbi:MAG: J domain-containing protein [Shimia sp.]|uniref:J domain-containing protein n=1 Tax=Shimia sp. TaxID=1954381 RepID=UPI001B1DC58B|nr:J domain-containing protein [Shimia sp.]MBO6899474.1 J domain-containing protein [Shimia sp.]